MTGRFYPVPSVVGRVQDVYECVGRGWTGSRGEDKEPPDPSGLKVSEKGILSVRKRGEGHRSDHEEWYGFRGGGMTQCVNVTRHDETLVLLLGDYRMFARTRFHTNITNFYEDP